MRISWSLSESFEDYLKRPRAERLMLHKELSKQIDRAYGGGGSKNDRNQGRTF